MDKKDVSVGKIKLQDQWAAREFGKLIDLVRTYHGNWFVENSIGKSLNEWLVLVCIEYNADPEMNPKSQADLARQLVELVKAKHNLQ